MNSKSNVREIFHYLIVGIITTIINFGIYFLWKALFSVSLYGVESAEYFLIINSGQIVAFVIATIFAFFANKKYVFNVEFTEKGTLLKNFWLFVLGRIAGTVILEIGLFNAIVALFAAKLPTVDVYAKIAMSAAVTVFNYATSKFAIFKKKTSSEKEQN